MTLETGNLPAPVVSTGNGSDIQRDRFNWVIATFEDQRRYRSGLIKEVRRDVELYNQDYKLDMPAKFHQVMTPTSKSVPDRAADRLGSGRFQHHIEARREGNTEQEHVEGLEKAAAAILYLIRKRVKYNPFRAFALHCFNRGAFVAKFQLDLDALTTAPERSKFNTDVEFSKAKKLWQYQTLSTFPMILDVRPIESIFPDPETDGDNYVIEHYLRRVGDVKKNYPNWKGWKNPPPGKGRVVKGSAPIYTDDMTIEYLEVWTKDWRGVIIDNDWVNITDDSEDDGESIDHPYGRPPYWIRYAGFGDPSGIPEKRCVSVLRAVRDTLRSESRMLSIIDTLAENEAYGATIMKTGDSGVASFTMAPSAINEVDFPEMVRPYKPESNLDKVMAALGIIQQQTEVGAVPGEAIGQGPSGGGGQRSGVAAAIETGQASMIIDPVKSALEDFVSDFIPFVLYMLDNVLDAPIALYAQVGTDEFVNIELGPDAIDGHYGPVYSTLKLQAPEDDYAKWNLGVQAIGSGLPWPFVFEKFFGIENGEAFAKDMFAHMLIFQPGGPVMAYLQQRIIAQLTAEDTGAPVQMPGQGVPMGANASMPQQPMLAPPPEAGGAISAATVPPNGMAAPPISAMARASAGMAPGPGVGLGGGAPVVTG